MEKAAKTLVILGTISGILWLIAPVVIALINIPNPGLFNRSEFKTAMNLLIMLSTLQIFVLVPCIILGFISVKKVISKKGISILSGLLLAASVVMLLVTSFLAGLLFLTVSILGFVRARKYQNTERAEPETASS